MNTPTQNNDVSNLASQTSSEGGSDELEATRGLALTEAIAKEVTNRKMTQREAANALGFSDSYFNVLMSNKRWWGSVDASRLLVIADFLDVPPITVYSLAEIVKSSFYYRQSTLEDQINTSINAIKNDPRFGLALPAESSWDKCPLDIKLFCCILHDQLSEKDHLEMRAKLLNIQFKDDEQLAD